MNLYCIMDLANDYIYTCEGTWIAESEKPVLFQSKIDAMTFIRKVLHLGNCGHVQPMKYFPENS